MGNGELDAEIAGSRPLPCANEWYRKVAAVIETWNNAGPHPEFHRRAMSDLKDSWPTLYNAVKALAEHR